ncbi:MAG: nuclear transport factor 2 family protein [Micropepsaceae bacterium]
MAAFAKLWSAPAQNVERFTDLLDPRIRLIAPGVPTTIGHAAASLAFKRLFKALPDMRGDVTRWSAVGDTLFIEMTFTATIGRRRINWANIDRISFKNGAAIERVAYFDPTPVRLAFLTSPRGWRQFATILWGRA